MCPIHVPNLRMCDVGQAWWPGLRLKLTQPRHAAFVEDIDTGG